ncbi:MAG: molybdopterin-dependent oxidoreductase [Proteobacteria bacterium]|nr:molybdopterin-dependent oxidoreductase [Pseudomonadota bacterium]
MKLSDSHYFKLPRDGFVHGVCPHDCPDSCSLLSHVEDGKLVKVEGNPEHPVTQGFICRKFAASPTRIYSSDRLRYPMKRTGRKGEGVFEQITWNEAIETITQKWKTIIDEEDPTSILPFYGSGTEGLVNGRIAGKRFFNRMGSLQLDRTICTKGGRTGFRYTMGTSMGADPCTISANKLIISWGTNTASTNIHHQVFLQEALRQGAKHVVINPVKTKGTESADYFFQPRPGSDAALALGMMHVIITESLFDEAFVERYTSGFDELKKRVDTYSPEYVATLTDIQAEEIRKLARLYARLKPSFIYVGPGCQRHSNGGMTLRTIACLPALVGTWANKGSGMYFPTSTIFPVDVSPLEGDELRPNPPVKYNMINLGRLLNDEQARIRSLYVFNGNPATVMFNQNNLRKGLQRDDLFTVVHEQYMTDTTRYADIVLPATTQFEHADLFFSYYHFNVQLNCPAIAPLGECLSNLDTFKLLAGAMGFQDKCFEQSSWDIIQDILDLGHPALNGVTFEKLREQGWCKANLEGAHVLVEKGEFPTASGRIEFFSDQMQQDGFDPLPCYIPPNESKEATPEHYAKYPFYFLTASDQPLLNSNYAQHVKGNTRHNRPRLIIHPDDATSRGITDGALVRVFNERGDCHLLAEISDNVKQGVVASPGLWWGFQYPHGRNPNHTTPDFTGDIGGGSAFNTNLVDIERSNETNLNMEHASHA